MYWDLYPIRDVEIMNLTESPVFKIHLSNVYVYSVYFTEYTKCPLQ
jgi:hypothetical protein